MYLAFSSKPICALSSLAPGESGVVVSIEEVEDGRAARLYAVGVTPGAPITVLQTCPGIVFLCDQTELAVERVVAAAIVVQR